VEIRQKKCGVWSVESGVTDRYVPSPLAGEGLAKQEGGGLPFSVYEK